MLRYPPRKINVWQDISIPEMWDGRDDTGRTAATGVYIYRLQAGTFNAVKKMLFAK